MNKLGIMLIIENQALISIARSLKLDPCDNIPYHITLYTLEIKEKDKDVIKKKAMELSRKYLPLEIFITKITKTNYGTIIFEVQNNEQLVNIHKSIINEIVKFRDKNSPSKAKTFYHEFSKEEQKLIDKYGRPNVDQKFLPHITIGKGEVNINQEINRSIELRDIKVYFDFGEGWNEI